MMRRIPWTLTQPAAPRHPRRRRSRPSNRWSAAHALAGHSAPGVCCLQRRSRRPGRQRASPVRVEVRGSPRCRTASTSSARRRSGRRRRRCRRAAATTRSSSPSAWCTAGPSRCTARRSPCRWCSRSRARSGCCCRRCPSANRTVAGSMVDTAFECCPDMSTPRSAITATTCGLTCDGCVPALWTRTRSPKRARRLLRSPSCRAAHALVLSSTSRKRLPGMHRLRLDHRPNSA